MDADDVFGCLGLCMMALGVLTVAGSLAFSIELSPVIHAVGCTARASAVGDCDYYIRNVTGIRGALRGFGIAAGIVAFVLGWILTSLES